MDRSPEGLMQRVDALAIANSPIATDIGRRQDNCAKHGVFLATGVRLQRGREIWTRCDGCRADAERAEQRAKAEQVAKRLQAERESQLDAAAIPPRFIGKTLETFNATTEAQRHAATVARDYIENFAGNLKRGDGLILSGMPGTGKSHIAAAILQGILPKHVGFYVTCMGAIRAVRETWRKDSERSEREVLNILGEVPLLVMDEIGVQYGTDGEQTVIFDILDRRYRDMMPTILLTNQDKAGLKQFIGDRAFDRLTETCRWVAFDWPSYRIQARREAV